jgi:hypothetical protein
MAYPSVSPYSQSEISNGYLNVMVDRPIPSLEDDAVVKINLTYHLRPDLLAHDLYGDSRLWWVFAQRNPNTLINPLLDFREGIEIWVPKLDTLKIALGF